MHLFDREKQSQFNVLLFTIKILALFIFSMPLYQFFFKDNTTGTFENINFAAIVISLLIICFITFMWVIMEKGMLNKRYASSIETVVFFAVCIASIIISGAHQSQYKFVFIFLIVIYTIESGYKRGLLIASLSSVFLIAMDLFLYHESGVNPFFQADIALSAMFIVIARILGFYLKIEKDHIDALKNYANIDGLTNAYNHRYLHQALKLHFDQSKTNATPLAFIIIDLDSFKVFNDIYGHQRGDDILRKVASIILSTVRSTDIVCRYGGDEFAVVMPNTDRKRALQIAESIRSAMAEYHFWGQEALPEQNLTASIGAADMLDEDDTFQRIISRADAALYRAKFLRKNRVEMYTSVFDKYYRLHEKPSNGVNTVRSMLAIINSRDSYTYSHTERVVLYCQEFAQYMNLSEDDEKTLVYSAYMHDVGKINISKNALIYEGKLTDDEWNEMRAHPIDSAKIAMQMEGMEGIANIVHQHHERFDGGGYPDGLRGDEIHPLARMLTIADSFDAMTANRPYQKSRTFPEAYEEIRRCSGTQFDPSLTEIFISAIRIKTKTA